VQREPIILPEFSHSAANFLPSRGFDIWIDVWFIDRRGRRAPETFVEYWGEATKLTGDMISRAACHYDTNEINRVNGYNRALLVFLVRCYIYGLASGQTVAGTRFPVGSCTSPRY